MLAVHLRKDVIRAGLNGQMQERHELFHFAMRPDKLVIHIARMRSSIADTLYPLYLSRLADKARKAPVPAVGSRAMISVHILAQQGHLGHAAICKISYLGQYVLRPSRRLRATRIGNHAEGAEFVATFLDSDEFRLAENAVRL